MRVIKIFIVFLLFLGVFHNNAFAYESTLENNATEKIVNDEIIIKPGVGKGTKSKWRRYTLAELEKDREAKSCIIQNWEGKFYYGDAKDYDKQVSSKIAESIKYNKEEACYELENIDPRFVYEINEKSLTLSAGRHPAYIWDNPEKVGMLGAFHPGYTVYICEENIIGKEESVRVNTLNIILQDSKSVELEYWKIEEEGYEEVIAQTEPDGEVFVEGKTSLFLEDGYYYFRDQAKEATVQPFMVGLPYEDMEEVTVYPKNIEKELGEKRFLKINQEGEILAGAKFVVMSGDEFFKSENEWTKNKEEAKVFKSATDGSFVIKGLEEKIGYKLIEIEAPEGYALLMEGVSFDVCIGEYNIEGAKPQKVVNRKLTIPQTGGRGSIGIIALGLVCIAIAVKRLV